MSENVLSNVFGSTLAYSVWIWLATGLILLRMDAVRLKRQGRGKEMKIAHFAGWFNLAAGIVLFLLTVIF